MRKFFLFTFLLLSIKDVHCQTDTTHFPYDQFTPDEDFEIPCAPTYFGLVDFNQNFPSAFSLRKFCPIPKNQRPYKICTAFAIGYGAYTILQSSRKQLTTQKEINDNTYSPLFLHNQYLKRHKTNCDLESSITAMVNTLNSEGICFEKNYPFEGNKCGSFNGITSALQTEARAFCNSLYTCRLWGNTGKFDSTISSINNSNSDKLSLLKRAILDFNPVLLRIPVYRSNFNKFYNKNSTYKMDTTSGYLGPHSVICVGYNDTTKKIEVLNSAGDKWGDKGYFYIDYADISKTVFLAVELSLRGLPTPTPINNSAAPSNIKININIQQPNTSLIPATFSFSNSSYNIHGLINKKFNIELITGNTSYNYYILNLDPETETNHSKAIVFPFSRDPLYGYNSLPPDSTVKENEGDANVKSNCTLTIPNKHNTAYNCFQKLNPQSEPFIILISPSELDVRNIIKEIDFQDEHITKTKEAIKKYHPTFQIANDISYLQKSIGFEGTLKSNEVLPIIIYLNK